MSTSTYVSSVLSCLPTIDDSEMSSYIATLEQDDFTIEEAVAYCRCMEEFNPTLEEDIALRRMSDIRLKIKQRQSQE